MYFSGFAEKIAEATRKYAALLADLQAASSDSTSPAGDAEKTGLRKRVTFLNRLTTVSSSGPSTTHKSMHSIKLAFSEFYLSLILLQNYQTLNFTGFRKILKKHDKVVLSVCYAVITCSLS